MTNVGTAMPTWAMVVATAPINRLRRTAARRPTHIANATAMNDDKNTSGSVTSSRATMSLRMASPVTSEFPRSPLTASRIQSTYCTTSGRSKPYSPRSSASASGVASTPSRVVAMSPGSTRNITKTNTLDAMTPPMATRSRRATPLTSHPN